MDEESSQGDALRSIRSQREEIERLDTVVAATIEAGDRLHHARQAVHRLLVAGNGGGAIATLGLIGTIVGSSSDNRAPRESLLLLAAFVVGLIASGVAAYARAFLAHAGTEYVSNRAHGETLTDRQGPMIEASNYFQRAADSIWKMDKWERLEKAGTFCSAVALALGITGGMALLWAHTRWFFI